MRAIPENLSNVSELESSGYSSDETLLNALGVKDGSHSSLIEPTLPLFANSWQKGRLLLGLDGKFPPLGRPARKDIVAINLLQAQKPAITKTGEARITLAYETQDISTAQSALVAASSQGGWPIAADNESLALLTLAQRIAASEIPVLLEGPTGTGKEVMARFIHRMSARSEGPFVAVNCAAMPEAMLEGLLFGHRKGAFTGAGEAREGLFAAADGGTLLLDEIGELPLALQAKLLRALQEGEVLPLGATKPVKIDVRIITATNRTLSAEVAAGRFREDLLYRLNVFPLVLPALRNRVRDIAPLAFGMLLRHAAKAGQPCWISSQALALLKTHNWPGNVRELENVIRRAILLAGKDPVLLAEHIIFDQTARAVDGEPSAATFEPEIPSKASKSGDNGSLSDVAFQSEAQAILQALARHAGHRGKTARSLGISERTLRYRLASMRESGLIDDGASKWKVGGSAGAAQQVMALRAEVLSRNQALRDVREASQNSNTQSANGPAQISGFAQTLNQALHDVSATQKHSADMQAGFERGEVTDIAQVMLARQEASVAFEATLQVRNKLLTAYQEIMRMGS